MKKQSILGAGPQIMLPGYIALIALALFTGKVTIIANETVQIIAASIWVDIGIAFLVIGFSQVRKAHAAGRLATDGLFAVTRHPVYCGQICFLLPGIALFINNWYCLAAAPFNYFIFKLFIATEERYLQIVFGDRFQKYCRSVNQILPGLLKYRKRVFIK